jgi:ferritin-like metal-binding protein YciE
MASASERLLEWLRDAHAMEKQAETMLGGMARRIESYPELKAKLQEHLDVTRRQAERVRQCIERRNGSPSTIKDAAGKMTAMGQALSGMFVGDEIVKGSMASYTFEHMEIAGYRILIGAADAAGDRATRQVCEEILAEEVEMANWLEESLPAVTQKYLRLEQTPGTTAKH